MNHTLNQIYKQIYQACRLEVSSLVTEPEGAAYEACRFQLNGLSVISRAAKITPKKEGQFVTFWKRNNEGITKPFHEIDDFDCYVINVAKDNRLGQFVIPKTILIDKGIVKTFKKDGKRGFRVYPPWDMPSNVQALKSQKWQLEYFYQIDDDPDFDKVLELYRIKA